MNLKNSSPSIAKILGVLSILSLVFLMVGVDFASADAGYGRRIVKKTEKKEEPKKEEPKKPIIGLVAVITPSPSSSQNPFKWMI